MPVKLTFFLLLLCNYSFSQIEGFRSATKFDKFITLDKIQWAAYANDVIRFDKYNLSDELYKRFQKGEIKITEPLSRDGLMTGASIIYIDKKQLQQKSYAPGSDVDSKPTNRVDSNSASLMNVEQILYVANGKLYSYVPWVSPLISVFTSRDMFIGTGEYFSSCINTKYNFKSSKRDDLIFITTTKRKLVIDTVPRTDMLKQLYGINMLEAIWKDIMNVKNEFTNMRNGEKLSQGELERFTSSAGMISFPLYDTLGRVTAYQNYSMPISPNLFQQIEITQDWYFNRTKNIVINTIPAITLWSRSKIFDNDLELIPVLKITFK